MALLGGQFALGGANGNLLSWDTVADVVSDAAIELGLIFDAVADPYASTDPNIRQLCGLLKPAGKMVVRERTWTHLQREFSFSTVPNQATYTLPADFREMIPQSGWDRTTLYQLGGPIGAEVWQLSQAIHIVGAIVPFIRFLGGSIEFTPTPVAVQTIAFEYVSWFWVKSIGQTSPNADVPSVATDTLCFNSDLMVRALKLGWEKAKRMDTTASQADYDRVLASEMNADAAAPEIHLGRGGEGPKRIGWDNVPMTGVGQ